MTFKEKTPQVTTSKKDWNRYRDIILEDPNKPKYIQYIEKKAEGILYPNIPEDEIETILFKGRKIPAPKGGEVVTLEDGRFIGVPKNSQPTIVRFDGMPTYIVAPLHPSQRSYQVQSIKDKLYKGGFPEEAIEANPDIWDFIEYAQPSEVISKNRNYHLKDKDGKQWFVKFYDNFAKAQREVVTTEVLSPHFSFLARMLFNEPLEIHGYYVNLETSLTKTSTQGITYWIDTIADIHRDTSNYFRLAEKPLMQVTLHRADKIADMNLHFCRLDKNQFNDAAKFLETTPYKGGIHADLKKDNLYGNAIVDLECFGEGPFCLDIAMLLMTHGIAKKEWQPMLDRYLRRKKSKDYNAEMRHLHEGLPHAVIYAATKEIVGSSLRPMTRSTKIHNRLLKSYLD